MRLSGIPHFFTEDSLEEEKDNSGAIHRAKQHQREEFAAAESLDAADHVRAAQITAVLRMQERFNGRIIRQTIDSKEWQGFQILNLLLYKTINAIVRLMEHEMKVIMELVQHAKDL